MGSAASAGEDLPADQAADKANQLSAACQAALDAGIAATQPDGHLTYLRSLAPVCKDQAVDGDLTGFLGTRETTSLEFKQSAAVLGACMRFVRYVGMDVRAPVAVEQEIRASLIEVLRALAEFLVDESSWVVVLRRVESS